MNQTGAGLTGTPPSTVKIGFFIAVIFQVTGIVPRPETISFFLTIYRILVLLFAVMDDDGDYHKVANMCTFCAFWKNIITTDVFDVEMKSLLFSIV